MRIKLVSSLEKCFLDEDIREKEPYIRGSMLKNEVFHFGVCFDLEQSCRNCQRYTLRIESALKEFISVSRVEHVPVHMPAYKEQHNENYLRTTPGLYPDLLLPQNREPRLIFTNTLQSLYIEVAPEGNAPAGEYPIELQFVDSEGSVAAREVFTLEIIDAMLPAQTLINTQWFYCDCLQVYYGTEAFDERHWQIIESFMNTAVKRGMNMILTPLFTPALDTYVGGERPTTQLVEVTVENGCYSFDFSKLGRWIDLCDKVGIQYLEMTHFFTQWGAKHAPKIMATVNGIEKKIFGWQTDACDEEYNTFLHALIPALLRYLKSHGRADKRCWFHISDEPAQEHLEQYKAARAIVEELLADYPIIDALSNYAFYEQGVVQHPIPSNDHIEPFLENKVPGLWTYYCCMQSQDVSNRFISMPSARNRIIGTQMYKYDIAGFLHWGYNFYNNQYSYAPVNPYLWTDGEYFVPAGDTFSVYPAADGTANESVRLAVFHEGLQDMRAMQLCEQLYDKEYVIGLIEQDIQPITFKSYPHSARWLLDMRQRVNMAIKNAVRTRKQ